MKVLRTGKQEIRTQWLSVEEAAEYCRMSVSTFARKRRILPCPSGNMGGHPKFYSPVLDEWLNRVNHDVR